MPVVHLCPGDGQQHQEDLHLSFFAEEHAWDKDMDIERYLQSTEEEIEEEGAEGEAAEEQQEEDASRESSASKKHRHIGEQTSLSITHAQADPLTRQPKTVACQVNHPAQQACVGISATHGMRFMGHRLLRTLQHTAMLE